MKFSFERYSIASAVVCAAALAVAGCQSAKDRLAAADAKMRGEPVPEKAGGEPAGKPDKKGGAAKEDGKVKPADGKPVDPKVKDVKPEDDKAGAAKPVDAKAAEKEKRKDAKKAAVEALAALEAAQARKGGKPEEKPVESPEAQPKDGGAAAADPATAPEFGGLSKPEAAFILACREAGSARGTTVSGRDGMIFSAAELRELGANRGANSDRHRGILGTLAAYAGRCRAAGVEFVFVPVPPKAIVFPDYVPSAAPIKNRQYDTYLQGLYKELSKAGVTVLDMTDDLRDDRLTKAGPMFPMSDGLWTGLAARSVAGEVFSKVRKNPGIRQWAKDPTILSEDVSFGFRSEMLTLRGVGKKEGTGLVPVPEAPGKSPIVVVGDANALAWHANGYPAGYKGSPRAGFSDQLAVLVGGPVELKASEGTGWRNASAQVNPGSGAAKAIVWCFSAIDLLRDPSAPVRPAAGESTGAGRAAPRPRREPDLPRPGGGLNLIEPDVNIR